MTHRYRSLLGVTLMLVSSLSQAIIINTGNTNTEYQTGRFKHL